MPKVKKPVAPEPTPGAVVPAAAAGGAEEDSDDELLTTSEAVRMIRDLLQGAKKYREQAAAEGIEDGKEATTPSAFADEELEKLAAEVEQQEQEDKEEAAAKEVDLVPAAAEQDLWVQTTLETAVEEHAIPHHVTPHVDHDVIMVEDFKEAAPAAAAPAAADAVTAESTALVVVPETAPTAPAPAAAAPVNNASMTCKLSDHRVQAGCTAVVALVVDRKLIVANAGTPSPSLSHAHGHLTPSQVIAEVCSVVLAQPSHSLRTTSPSRIVR